MEQIGSTDSIEPRELCGIHDTARYNEREVQRHRVECSRARSKSKVEDHDLWQQYIGPIRRGRCRKRDAEIIVAC